MTQIIWIKMREYIGQLNCSEAGSLPYEVPFEGLGRKTWGGCGTQTISGCVDYHVPLSYNGWGWRC